MLIIKVYYDQIEFFISKLNREIKAELIEFVQFEATIAEKFRRQVDKSTSRQ